MDDRIYAVERHIHMSTSFTAPFLYSIWKGLFPFFPSGLGILDCKKNYTLKRREKGGYSFLYIISGAMQLYYNKETFHLSEGQMVLINLQIYHEFQSANNNPFQYLFINISGRPPVDILYEVIYKNGFHPARCTDSGELMAIFENLKKLAGISSPESDMIPYSFVSLILSNLYRDVKIQESMKTSSYVPKWCAHVMSYMKEHYWEKIDFGQLASECFVSPPVFSREFKKAVGITPTAYLTNVRLYRAELLLLHTTKNLEIIAQETGFSNTSRFIKAFREKHGMTPAQYRNRLNG